MNNPNMLAKMQYVQSKKNNTMMIWIPDKSGIQIAETSPFREWSYFQMALKYRTAKVQFFDIFGQGSVRPFQIRR